ncbi:unnamed protein product [Aphanomyces euteiches]
MRFTLFVASAAVATAASTPMQVFSYHATSNCTSNIVQNNYFASSTCTAVSACGNPLQKGRAYEVYDVRQDTPILRLHDEKHHRHDHVVDLLGPELKLLHRGKRKSNGHKRRYVDLCPGWNERVRAILLLDFYGYNSSDCSGTYAETSMKKDDYGKCIQYQGGGLQGYAYIGGVTYGVSGTAHLKASLSLVLAIVAACFAF